MILFYNVCVCVCASERQSINRAGNLRGVRENVEEGGADVPCRLLLRLCSTVKLSGTFPPPCHRLACALRKKKRIYLVVESSMCPLHLDCWITQTLAGQTATEVPLELWECIIEFCPGKNVWVHVLGRWQGDPAQQGTQWYLFSEGSAPPTAV